MRNGVVVLTAGRSVLDALAGNIAYARAAINAYFGRWDKALRAYEVAVARCPRKPEWQFQLGKCREQLRDWSGAATAYKRASRRSGSNPQWFYRLGFVQEMLGDNEAAVKAYRAALKKDESVVEWHLRYGFTYERLGKWSKAASAYKHAINLFPNEVSLYERLAFVLCRSGRYKSAIRAYKAAINHSPDHGELRFKLGNLYEKIGNLAAATKCIQHAVRLEGENPKWHFRLAQLLEQQRNWGRAAAAYQRALNCGMGKPEVFYRLAYVSERRRDWNTAEGAYRQVYSILGDRMPMDIHYRLCKLYELRRAWPEASRAYLSSYLDARKVPFRTTQVAGGEIPKPAIIESQQTKARLLLEGNPLPYDRYSAREIITEASDVEQNFPTSWWIAVSHRLHYLGWVYAAHLAKQVAARTFLAKYSNVKDASLDDRIRVVKAMVFLGLLSEAAQVVNSIKIRKAQPVISRINTEINLLLGSAKDGGDVAGDEDFAALVVDKRIAIVAPGATELLQGSEIDSYDLVIRPHFHSDEIIAANADRIGRKTNISYYNQGFEKKFRGILRARLSVSPLNFIVLARSTPEEILQGYIEAGQAARSLSPGYNLMFGGHPLGMLRILRDINRFRPKAIKMFCADCYTRPQKYFPGYNQLATRAVAETTPMGLATHIKHDLGQNFVILQRLFQHRMFEGDPVVENVLGWSLEHYLDVLEEKFITQNAIAAENEGHD